MGPLVSSSAAGGGKKLAAARASENRCRKEARGRLLWGVVRAHGARSLTAQEAQYSPPDLLFLWSQGLVPPVLSNPLMISVPCLLQGPLPSAHGGENELLALLKAWSVPVEGDTSPLVVQSTKDLKEILWTSAAFLQGMVRGCLLQPQECFCCSSPFSASHPPGPTAIRACQHCAVTSWSSLSHSLPWGWVQELSDQPCSRRKCVSCPSCSYLS